MESLSQIAGFDRALSRDEILAHFKTLDADISLNRFAPQQRGQPYTKTGVVKINDGQYHHIVVVRDRLGARASYFDGKMEYRNLRHRVLHWTRCLRRIGRR